MHWGVVEKLPLEYEIMGNWSSDHIQLSITCIAYNHAPFIEETIKGFLIQKTNFPFEIIIHDDASTDNTQQIIKHYATLYPGLIRPILQTENHWLGKGINATTAIVWPSAKGKYIAWCEGDDYWTDPLKLQKQVDYLETHSEVAICFHPAFTLTGGKFYKTHFPPRSGHVFYFTDILTAGNFIATASVVFRNRLIFPDWKSQLPIGDIPLYFLATRNGSMGFINEIMSVYRLSNHGIWVGSSGKKQCEMWIDLYNLLIPLATKKERRLMYHALAKQYEYLAFKRFPNQALRRILQRWYWLIKLNIVKVIHSLIINIRKLDYRERWGSI